MTSTHRRTTTRALRGLLALVLAATPALLSGCRDSAKESAAGARGNAEWLVPIVDQDVAEVERGLPAGSKKVTDLLTKELGKDGDPTKNDGAVRNALQRTRQQVPDLGRAKSTFFALSDTKGIGIRNDQEQDTMAGKDLVSAWPGLKPALADAPYAATIGRFPGPANPYGPDKEWVAAVPVKRADGAPLGLLVTGWTFRRFAYHLQESLKRELQDRLMREGDKGKMPILYVALFDKEAVYGASAPRAPEFPQVNEKALSDLGLVEKTAAGPAEGTLTITNRPFGWAAVRTPRLGADTGVVVLRSEI